MEGGGVYIGGNRVEGMHHIKKTPERIVITCIIIIMLIVRQKCNETIAKSYALTLHSISSFFLHMFLILIPLLTHTYCVRLTPPKKNASKYPAL